MPLWLLILIGFAGLLFLVQCIELYIFSFYPHVHKKWTFLPGPSILHIGYRVMCVKSHLYSEVIRMSKIYGKVFHMFVGPQSSVVIADWSVAKKVLTHTSIFPKYNAFTNEKLHQFWGLNVLTAEGDNWKRQRNIVNTGFADISIFIPTFNQVMDIALQQLQSNPQLSSKVSENTFCVKVKPLVQRSTLDILGKSVFGYDFNYLYIGSPMEQNAEKKNAIAEAQLDSYNYIMSHAFNIFRTLLKWVYYIPFVPSNKKVDLAIEKFENLVYELIDVAKKKNQSENSNQRQTLLDFMVQSAFEEQKLSDKELRDNIVVLFVAGHETVANSITFALIQLADKKLIQDKARREVLSIYERDGEFTFENLKEMEYLGCVAKEVLRLFPPIGILNGRLALEDQIINEYRLPKGSAVQVFIYAINRDPDLWGSDSEEFKPERFLEQEGEKKKPPLLSFSYGPRVCMGNTYSLFEMKMFIAKVLLNFDLEVHADWKQKPIPIQLHNLALSPDDDYPVLFTKRC